MSLRPETIQQNIHKRCRAQALEQLNLLHLAEGQISNTSLVNGKKQKFEESDEDENYDNDFEDNQSDNYSDDNVDMSGISFFDTDDLGFEIFYECDQLIEKKCSILKYPEDSLDILGSGSVTKQEFSQRLNDLISQHQLTTNLTSELLILFKDINPESNFPMHETLRGNLRMDIKAYVRPNNSAIYIDACESECMIFSGKNKLLTKCSTCYVNRYFDCTETSCKNKSYEECKHSHRRSKKTIMYRPIIPILAELLSHQFFLDALNYVYCKPDFNSNKYEYMDIADGNNAKEALGEMKKIFNDTNLAGSHTDINLLFGIFYDGIQLYHSKAIHFWPCFLTILNLPPSMRNEIGVGMFLCTIYTGHMGTTPERFIVEHCIIKEFISLKEGLKWSINGKNYFVQGRLIHHFLDTKALGQELKVQEANSYAGCPLCLQGKGSSRLNLKNITYGNYRKFLSANHFLRSRGNSTQCCPRDYWQGKNININASTTKNVPRYNDNPLSVNDPPRFLNFKSVFPCFPNKDTDEAIEYFKSALNLNNNIPFDWYHDESLYSKNNFTRFLHYPHGLISSEVKFKRKTQIEFQKDGYLASHGAKKISNGVKGLWPFSEICDVEKHIEYDPFHSVSGICLLYLLILKGTRLSPNKKSFCKKYNIHPYMFPENFVKTSVPFLVNEKSQRLIDACVACILIPFGHSKHFQINNIFSETGNLRGKDKIGIFMILIPFLNLIWNIDETYKSYFAMFSSDLVELYSFNMSGNEIDQLCKKLFETCAVHEGLFTEAECTMLLHELIHLPFHMKKMGTVYNFHTLFGERAVKNVKVLKPDGGKSFYNQITESYDDWESCKTKRFYTTPQKELYSYKLNVVGRSLHYNEYTIRLCGEIKMKKKSS